VARDERADGRRQTIDDVLRPSGERDLRRLPKLLLQAFRLVWDASRRQLVLAGGLQLAAGLSLAGQLLVARSVLQRIEAQAGAPDLLAIVPQIALFGALLVVVALAAVAQREQQRILSEEVTKYTTGHVLDVATAVELIEFDRPAFYDRLERARVNASTRPVQITSGVLGLLSSGAAVVAVGIALVAVEPMVALVVGLGGLPTLYFNRLAARALHAYTIAQTPGDRRRAYLFQILTRKDEAQEIRAFDSQAYLRDEHDRLFDARIEATHRVAGKRILFGVSSGAIMASVTVGAIVVVLVFIQRGRLSLGDAALTLGALIIVSGRLRGLVASTGSLYEGALFLTDFTDFVEAGRGELDRRRHAEKVEPFRELVLDDVAFTYPSRTFPSLTGVSLTIRRGEVLALVGENGSGKTTLTKLLAGLYRPDHGVIRWDGVDRTEEELSVLREHVTVIFQDFARYFLTAHQNVAISRHAALDDTGRVERAAAQAGAAAYIEELPDGYDSLLGPSFVGGSDLSLGQWQRLALARAYFRDAPMLILDEPTASLDPRGEFEIFEHVRDLAAGNTVVLVSHRFSNVRIADRIVVLDRGRIVEIGSHEELMAAEGLYAELFELQARGYHPEGWDRGGRDPGPQP
jgi:ATP-binding cassette, subfamily B, bacterial